MTDAESLNIGRFYVLYQRIISSNFKTHAKEDSNKKNKGNSNRYNEQKNSIPMLDFLEIFYCCHI